MREYMTNKEIDKLVDEIMKIPVEKNNKCLSTYGSINVDDLINTVKELKKVPTYDYLLKEVTKIKEQQKEFINYLKSMLDKETDNFSVARVKDILEKYKEIIGSGK